METKQDKMKTVRARSVVCMLNPTVQEPNPTPELEMEVTIQGSKTKAQLPIPESSAPKAHIKTLP